MNIKKRITLLTIVCFFLLMSSGIFVNAQEEVEEVTPWKTTVYFGTSVDRAEAIAIAKEFLRFKKIANDYYLTKRLVKKFGGVWHVVFLKKTKGYKIGKESSMRITIDSKTGEIIQHGDQEGYFLQRRL